MPGTLCHLPIAIRRANPLPQRRFGHRTIVGTLQVMSEPAERLVQEPDAWPACGEIGRGVLPWPYDRADGTAPGAGNPQHRRHVLVSKTAVEKKRRLTLKRGRLVRPIGIVTLKLQPFDDPRTVRFQPLQPNG